MKYIIPTLYCRCQPSYKISSKYLNPRLNYNNFLKIQDGGRLLSWIFDNLILSNRSPWVVIFHHCIKFGAKMLVDAKIMAPKSKSTMAAVRHLGFVTSSYRTTHEVFSLGQISLSNFMLIWCIVLIFFLQIWLEMPIHALKFWFLEGLNSRPPKGISLAKTALTCQFWCRSVHWCDLGGCWRNKKKEKKGKERNLQWQTGCSPRPPTLDAAICGLACRVVFGR